MTGEGQFATLVESDMESTQAIDFGSCEQINNEIRRRALCLAQTDPEVQGDEDPYLIASREIFEELLTRFAGVERAA